jgi:hypothetical protein
VYGKGKVECLHIVSLAEVLTSVQSRVAQLLFDSKKLVVLGKTLRAAGSTSLDLTSSETDDNISYEKKI